MILYLLLLSACSAFVLTDKIQVGYLIGKHLTPKRAPKFLTCTPCLSGWLFPIVLALHIYCPALLLPFQMCAAITLTYFLTEKILK